MWAVAALLPGRFARTRGSRDGLPSALENRRRSLYGMASMTVLARALLVSSLTFAALGATLAGAVDSGLGTSDAAASEAAALPPPEMVRYGNRAFSFQAPTSWVRLSGTEELRVRLHYVAHLREVLDAPPDVPPDSFESLLAFAAFRIPEVDGYLIATLLDMEATPQQILDVIHIHARGKNDWGNSLYLTVDDVVRNQRFLAEGEPALVVDVMMSGGFGIAAKYFRVPSDFHRIGGLAMMLPRERWAEFEPLANAIRDSVRIGSSPEPKGEPVPGIVAGDAAHWESVQARQAQLASRAGPRRPRPPAEGERTMAMTAGEITARLIVIAMAYALVFFVTIRLIYFAILWGGRYVVPNLDLDAYREAADKEPWTLGLLKSERMIMLCATTSMALAGVLLALFLRY